MIELSAIWTILGLIAAIRLRPPNGEWPAGCVVATVLLGPISMAVSLLDAFAGESRNDDGE